jgi:hypothetical protein
MMRTLLLAILLLLPAPLYAADGPGEFLAGLLASDFEGDCIPRHDNVLYTDGVYFLGNCDCGESRSNFNPDSSPLVIVSRWQVAGTRMVSRNQAFVTVRFRVLATAKGQNEARKIKAHFPPRDESVTFRVWRRKGRWMWVDPPVMPRVGFEAVHRAVSAWKNELEEVQRLDPHPNTAALIAAYIPQLAAIEALRPAYEADRQAVRPSQ